jgi:hypothetical protein
LIRRPCRTSSPGIAGTRSPGIALLVLLLAPGIGRAQAWLPPQGEGNLSVLYQDSFVKYHELPGVGNLDRGHVTTHTLLVDFAYGLNDKVAVSVGIPWIASKYNGSFPHTLAGIPQQYWIPTTFIDSGAYNSAFQDFRFDVRYNVTKKGIVLTPFVGSVIPSHAYTYYGHSAVGRDLRQLQVGTLAAKTLDSLVPGLFVQGRYTYGFSEKVLGVSHDTSNMDLEIWYFVTPRMRLMALSAGQITHGGVDLTLTWKTDLGPLAPHHDQVARDNFLNVGGGAAYALTHKIDLFGSVVRTVAERNGHVLDYGLAVGLNWSFTTSHARARAIAEAERHLVKCICEKGM